MTEDVILMGSVDFRIRQAAKRAKERRELIAKLEESGTPVPKPFQRKLERQDLEELRELLTDEIYNMQQRFTSHLVMLGRLTNVERRLLVKHLHTMTYDETFKDVGPGVKYPRTRVRIEALLELCDGDERLLLHEYEAALKRFFPVWTWSKYYAWNPKLFTKKLKSGKTRISIRHSMTHISNRQEEEEE